MKADQVNEVNQARRELWGDFLLFVRTFFPLVTGRQFVMSYPTGRQSHFITISDALTDVMLLKTPSLLINVPPGHAKSTLVSYFVAWTMSMYPDSQFLYISYGHELAAKHTAMIKRIMEIHEYRNIFDVHLRHDSRAKDYFQTTAGGTVKAFGSAGAITGQDAGLPNLNRFSGAVILDDALKPDEAHSDTIRERVLQNYKETILQRPRGPNVPIICIAQRLHEDDLPAYMLSGNDERRWKAIVLKALDDSGNALYPEVNSREQLLEKKEKNPYVFSAQFQQEPTPSGGAIFHRSNFVFLEEEPEMMCTFITADTAETEKNYNDATVFSFWGLYKLPDTEHLALHWIDCVQIRIEPKDLEYEFKDFWAQCCRYPVKPKMAAIEKRSTGTTLISIIKDIRGLEVRDIKRTPVAANSKSQRYLEIQPILYSKLISFPENSKHSSMCINQAVKITANGSHRWDDIIDTLYDAIKIALIDKTLYMGDLDSERHLMDYQIAHKISDRISARAGLGY